MYKTGPQDGKPETYDGVFGKSGNFTVVGFADEQGLLLYRDEETGTLFTDGDTIEEWDDLTGVEVKYLRAAGWTGTPGEPRIYTCGP